MPKQPRKNLAAATLRRGLELLGIEVLEEM